MNKKVYESATMVSIKGVGLFGKVFVDKETRYNSAYMGKLGGYSIFIEIPFTDEHAAQNNKQEVVELLKH